MTEAMRNFLHVELTCKKLHIVLTCKNLHVYKYAVSTPRLVYSWVSKCFSLFLIKG